MMLLEMNGSFSFNSTLDKHQFSGVTRVFSRKKIEDQIILEWSSISEFQIDNNWI